MVFALAVPLEALLLESWEGTGVLGIGDSQGPWTRMKEAPKDLTVAFSPLHASDGDFSLAIRTPGGWVQALSNTVNFTDAVPHLSLRQAIASRGMLSVDVFTDESLGEARVTLLMLGSKMLYTSLQGETFRCGDAHVLRFMIDNKVAANLKNDDDWFQFIFVLQSSGAGTIYLDNLRIE